MGDIEPMAEQIEAEREQAHEVLRAIFNNEDGPWQCALKDRAHDEDCDVITTALARLRVEAADSALSRAATLVARFGDTDGLATGDLCDAIRALRANKPTGQ